MKVIAALEELLIETKSCNHTPLFRQRDRVSAQSIADEIDQRLTNYRGLSVKTIKGVLKESRDHFNDWKRQEELRKGL